MAFLWAVRRTRRLKSPEAGENSFIGGELSLPSRVVRVSRSDRQTRYYSERRRCASGGPKSGGVGANVRNQGMQRMATEQGLRSKAQNATRRSGVLRFPCWSLASQQIMAGVEPRAYRRLLRPVFPFRAARWADALAGRLLFCGLAGIFQQPVHHWRPTNSNLHAVHTMLLFQWVRGGAGCVKSGLMEPGGCGNPENGRKAGKRRSGDWGGGSCDQCWQWGQ